MRRIDRNSEGNWWATGCLLSKNPVGNWMLTGCPPSKNLSGPRLLTGCLLSKNPSGHRLPTRVGVWHFCKIIKQNRKEKVCSRLKISAIIQRIRKENVRSSRNTRSICTHQAHQTYMIKIVNFDVSCACCVPMCAYNVPDVCTYFMVRAISKSNV